MDEATEDFIKLREISFNTLHPDPRQAYAAATLLEDVAGVLELEVVDDALLRVRYHILQTTLADLEALVEERGFHLDNGIIQKVKRALYRYTEETQRANLGCTKGESNCTRKVFATSYQQRDHGCRDERPQLWRRYL
ncbi:MAG: hypothetical protein P8106_03445 [Gammaproteobacteria bacterium]